MTSLPTLPRSPSGRPGPDEFAIYAQSDIDAVIGDDAVAALETQQATVLSLLSPLCESSTLGLTYGHGKWTLKEVLGHLIDDERIYVYRALCIARGDLRPLSGFDENAYMALAEFESRSLQGLLHEYRAVREASIAFFRNLPNSAWVRSGVANSVNYSVRGLAFHIAGHELHHLRFLRDNYLNRSPAL